jgi:hypothetical protein
VGRLHNSAAHKRFRCASMQVAAAYQNGYLAFGDLVNSLGAPAVYNLQTGLLDPLSMLPVGNPWQAARTYQVGECVTPAAPVGGNSHIYRCTRQESAETLNQYFRLERLRRWGWRSDVARKHSGHVAVGTVGISVLVCATWSRCS